MDQKNKALLFVDLCGRYPYGVIVNFDGKKVCVDDIKFIRDDYYLTLKDTEKTYIGVNVERVKPYLRSMKSMTVVEKEEYKKTFDTYENGTGTKLVCQSYQTFDWLNVHHFDYRGLIELGLALEAPQNMYL